MEKFKGAKRIHRKVAGAFEWWRETRRKYRLLGLPIPKGTRAPGSKVSTRVEDIDKALKRQNHHV